MGRADDDGLKQSQANAILNRAIELQHEQGAGPPLSMAEVEAVAGELGVEPRFVRAATAELARTPARPEPFHILGASTRILREHTFVGPLLPDEVETIFALARQQTDAEGDVKDLGGGALSWRGDGLRVTVIPGIGSTSAAAQKTSPKDSPHAEPAPLTRVPQNRVLISRPMGGLAVSLFVPILIPTGLGILGAAIPLGVVYGALFTPIVGSLLAFALAFQGVRMIFASSVAHQQREVSALAELIAAHTDHPQRHTLPPMPAEQASEAAPAEIHQTAKARR